MRHATEFEPRPSDFIRGAVVAVIAVHVLNIVVHPVHEGQAEIARAWFFRPTLPMVNWAMMAWDDDDLPLTRLRCTPLGSRCNDRFPLDDIDFTRYSSWLDAFTIDDANLSRP